MSLTVGSLFAGIGGFDLGFERAGFKVSWCVEWDRAAQRVLAARFPGARIHGDVTQVSADDLGRVDVICGGFPCQDLSVAGKRAGLAGERSGLFHEAMRIVRQLQPRIVVLENVPGLLSSNRGHDFATVLREMGEGWDCSEVAWRVLDSRYFGVAQRRRRVFIAASAAGGSASKVLALTEGVHWHPAACDSSWKGSACASEGSPGSDRIVNALTSKMAKGTGGPSGDECQNLVAFRKSRRAQSINDNETWVMDGVANTLNQFDVGDVRTTHAVAVDVYNQAVDGDCAATVTTTTGGSTTSGPKVVTDMRVRRLTPVECERLQGFPDDWTNVPNGNRSASDTQRYKQIGNAVTVNVAEWVAQNARKELTDAVQEQDPASVDVR